MEWDGEWFENEKKRSRNIKWEEAQKREKKGWNKRQKKNKYVFTQVETAIMDNGYNWFYCFALYGYGFNE